MSMMIMLAINMKAWDYKHKTKTNDIVTLN